MTPAEAADRDARFLLAVANQQKTSKLITDQYRDRILFWSRLHPAARVAARFGLGYQGYGNGCTGFQPRLLLPRQRKRTRPHLNVSREQIAANALVGEQLVPVRLELESDKHRLRDTFTWNSEERVIRPEYFAQVYCADHSLPPAVFASQIAKSVAEQLADFHPHQHDHQTVLPQHENSPPWCIYKDDDLRIVVKLDVTIGSYNLVDAFEWDINCPSNVPELFAAQLAADLCLCGEFVTAIAHQIREQCQQYTKTLVLLDHKPGEPIQDEEVRQNIVPTLTTTLRADTWSYTPTVSKLSPEEIEKQDQVRDRETRRKRRQLRAGRRGVALPDFSEIFKTHRTPCRHSVLPPGDLPTLKQQRTHDEEEEEEEEEEEDGFDDFSEENDYSDHHHDSLKLPLPRPSKIVKLKIPRLKLPLHQPRFRPPPPPFQYQFRPTDFYRPF